MQSLINKYSDVQSETPVGQAEDPGPYRSRYYLSDDSADVIILVENWLYKLHKWQLISASDVLRDMFSMPPADHSEGKSDDNPIRLPYPNVKKIAFDAFLDFQYLGMYKRRNPLELSHEDRVTKDWESLEESTVYHLLKLCLYRQCDTIVEEIIRAVDSGKKLHPVFKIAFALEPFDKRMLHWVAPAYTELINRTRGLSKEEVDLIGSERAAVICEFRERRIEESRPQGGYYPGVPQRVDPPPGRWFYTVKFNKATYGVPELIESQKGR